ncbi:MAG: membrane protein insertion efficiency factor YidD [Candidatus Nanopelagicaceae bacterium]
MRKLAVGLIGIYQMWISPMFPPRCKYYPSCSSYAATAISTYGLKGFAMATWRLVRCNPWSYGGVDYVPAKKVKNNIKQSHNDVHISGGVTR